MKLFIFLAVFFYITAGKGDSKSGGLPDAPHSQKDDNEKHRDSHHDNPKQDHHKNGNGDNQGNGHGKKNDKGHGNKPDNGHGNKPDNGHGNKPDNGPGNKHDSGPDSEDSKECDEEYVFSQCETKIERCRDGKDFFYTDRYKNETFCSNSATIDDGECWWDTDVGSNCLESTECVWLTKRSKRGLCYCSHSVRCEACEHQTPAPTVNIATSQCSDKCEIYYLGCVGMYCKCLGKCTSSAEAGCSEPINAGCHSYYFGKDDQGDREDGEDGTITDEIDDLIDATGKTIPEMILKFWDENGKGRYEIFGDFAYEYRNGLLMRIISTSLVDLDKMMGPGKQQNDWLDDLTNGVDDLINGSDEDDDDNDWSWSWPWFG